MHFSQIEFTYIRSPVFLTHNNRKSNFKDFIISKDRLLQSERPNKNIGSHILRNIIITKY